MKAKLKNANPAVRVLLQHGEKIGIAAVVIVAALLIYKSLGREKLSAEQQPDRLRTAAQQADQTVRNMVWQNFPEDERTIAEKVAAKKEQVVLRPVGPEDFPKLSTPWNDPVIPPAKLRSDPVLLDVQDLEVNSGSGLWLSGDPEKIRQKMIEAAKEAEAKAKEQAEEAERMAREAEERGGGRGGERGYGPGGGFGEGGRGYGDMGNMGGMQTRDGAIIMTPPGGAQMQGFEDIRNESWVTVVGKIPIKEQFDMYEDALATARGFSASNDMPRYVGYLVERAEITEAGQGQWQQLPAVKDSTLIKIMQRWPVQTPEIANPKYVHPLLTYPLPPMVMRTWGKEVTHSDLPLPTPEDLMGGPEVAEGEAPKAQEEPADPDSPFGEVLKRAQPAAGYGERGGYGGYGGGERMMGGGYGGYGGGERMMGGYGGGERMMGGYGGGERMMGGGYGGYGRGEGMMGGYSPGMGAGLTELQPKDWDGRTKYWLFRYFDNTVEPGHQYRYRVRLALFDVNALQAERYLASEVTARLSKEKADRKGKPNGYLLTEWSEPSPVAVVPREGLIYVASVKPGNQNSEPEARLVVKSLDADLAAEVAISEFFPRGSVINRERQAQVIWSSLYKPDPENKEESPTFDFLSGLTLLDFEGGESLTSKNRELLAPARALVMDSAGRMRLQNELDDQKDVRQYDMIMKAAKEAAARQRDQGDEGGPGRGRRGR
ncbi:MAG: hypothetical protein IT424_08390 [Pirellulales bacterium]|nr:hypothetical protein [Pirellulales bacterium]